MWAVMAMVIVIATVMLVISFSGDDGANEQWC